MCPGTCASRALFRRGRGPHRYDQSHAGRAPGKRRRLGSDRRRRREERLKLQCDVDSVPFWWHSIDLGDGLVTPGHKTPDVLARELEALRLPDVRGRSVLDIGGWDGFFAFEAERRGARRVAVLDHYMWSMDILGQQGYWTRMSIDRKSTRLNSSHLPI